ncbi:MAG: hypothetical protein ACFFDK_03620 [Promethearchaeota archaeon]
MNKPQIFDLEKIKELTNPIEELQGNVFEFQNNFTNYTKYKEKEISELPFNKDFSNQIQTVTQMLEEISRKLIKISNLNINKYLIFQDNLIKKYKDSFKENLKKLKIDQTKTKKIGIFLIENRKISKIIDKSSYIYAIELNQWLDLLESLKSNSLFQSSINRCKKFYNLLVRKKLTMELNKIPEDVDPVLISDFKKAYLKNPEFTFKEFLQIIEKKLTEEELGSRRIIIEQTKEKEKLKELKKKQEAQRQSYEDYLRLSDKEFEKMRRKKKRKKLSELTSKQELSKQIQISEEISEKIEKFKSKFENSFEEKYLVQKDDDIDPLDIIRERKKQKDEEYKDHIKKFKNVKE